MNIDKEINVTEVIKNKKTKKKVTQIEEVDKIYGLYLAVQQYKNLLDKNEYIIKDNGDVLLGLYKNKDLAMQHKDKFSKRGILVTLATE